MVARLILLIILLLAGCATTLTPAEQLVRDDKREWRRGINLENWLMCDSVYKEAGVLTIHINHRHRTGRHKNRGFYRITDWDIRSDLLYNNCRFILRDYWIKY